MIVTNLTPHRFTGWARGTHDGPRRDGAFVGEPRPGSRIVYGPPSGLETQIVDVLVSLEPWESATVNPDVPSALALPLPPPADPLSHFGGPLQLNGRAMAVKSFTPEGAAWMSHCTARIGELFHVDVWLRWYPGEPYAVGECMVTASKAGSPLLSEECPSLVLTFGDGAVHPLGLPVGAPIVAAGTKFGDGQARVIPFAVLWTRLVTDPQQFANFMAVQSLGISVRGCKRSFHDGNPRFGAEFSARRWAAQHFGRSAMALHTWVDPVLGPRRSTGWAGGQEDQAFAGAECLLADGAGAETVNYLAALHFAGHPCHHLEADGSMVDSITRPRLRMFYSRPHRSGSDMLGKPRDQTMPETNGWNGPDAQHWFFSRLAMAARFMGTPACQRLLEHQARNYLVQLTTTPGAPTSKVWSAREVGWEGIAAAHLWRELCDRGLAERVRHHWMERANWLSSQLPVTGPWDVLVDVGSIGTGSWWMPWQQSLGAYGLDLACRVLGDGGTHLPLIAANAAKLVVDQAWTNDGARWVEWELLALDGRRQRSDDFQVAFMALAVATVIRNEPTNDKAREIMQQMHRDDDGTGKWLLT
jgi:hypothetical protein